MARHAVLLLVALVLACGREQKGFDSSGLAGPLVVPPLPKPELLLRDTDGRSFDLVRATEGKVTLLFFGYTRCPDKCPVQLANIAGGLKRLDPGVGERLSVVFVTVDPARDTPAEIRAYLDHFDRRFIGLTGDSASIASAFTQLRLGQPMAGHAGGAGSVATIDHNVVVLAFTRDNLAHVAYLSSFTPDQWAHDLAILTRGT